MKNMSYEGKMLKQLEMPTRIQVEQSLLKTLFSHNGTIKEFGSGQEIVDEIADEFNLNENQRTAFLETIYRKENRVKRSLLWHRLLFRAADALAKENFVSRPTLTINLTKKKEWMLTEKGFDEALKLLGIPTEQKDFLPVKSFEVEKIVKKITQKPRPESYNPFDNQKRVGKVTREFTLRERGFRMAVIETYNYQCAFCKLKIYSPKSLLWEVQAAHIVPHSAKGRDDIWNGIALCRLHHWAFDVGWLTVNDDFTIRVSPKINSLPIECGNVGNYDFIRAFVDNSSKIFLPENEEIYPHQTAINWHQENIFCK